MPRRLKKGLTGLLASVIVATGIGCSSGENLIDYSAKPDVQRNIGSDSKRITYEEWKNARDFCEDSRDLLKEKAQYIVQHPEEAYELFSEQEKREYESFSKEVDRIIEAENQLRENRIDKLMDIVEKARFYLENPKEVEKIKKYLGNPKETQRPEYVPSKEEREVMDNLLIYEEELVRTDNPREMLEKGWRVIFSLGGLNQLGLKELYGLDIDFYDRDQICDGVKMLLFQDKQHRSREDL